MPLPVQHSPVASIAWLLQCCRRKIWATPSSPPPPPIRTSTPFRHNPSQTCSLQTSQICLHVTLSVVPRPLPGTLCVSLPWRSSSLSMAPLVPQTSPHSPHRPCCVSHCLVCFKTFSIRTLSLSCSLCCSSAPWNAGCGNVTVTRCLDTCREQAVRLCFCGWLSGNHLCSRPGLVISRVASWKSLAFLSLSVFYCCVSWTPWCLTVLILRPMACVYSCPLSSHERL